MKFQIKLPKDSIQIKLQTAIAQAVFSLQGHTLQGKEVKLEHPAREEYGDWSTNVAMKLKREILRLPGASHRAKRAQAFGSEAQARRDDTIALKKFSNRVKSNNNGAMKQCNNPIQLAQAIKIELEKQHLPFIDTINVVNGFINISIKKEWLISQMERVIKEGKDYGRAEEKLKQKIMVEFAHPNTHKLFHIGHLRNITTGETIVRILEAVGVKVVRANYQGDVGMHIAKSLWAILQNQNVKIKNQKGVIPDRLKAGSGIYKNKFIDIDSGSEAGMTLNQKIAFLSECYVAGNKAYEEDEQASAKGRKEITQINKKIYDQSDPKINKLWKETRAWSLEYFNRIYKRVGSHFDRLYFESEVFQRGREIVLANLGKVFTRSKGAIIFEGSKYGLHDRVFVNSEGNPTYEGKDMGLGELQFKEHNPDLIIHVVGPEQATYFQVVFKALEKIMPETQDREYHLKYGWVKLKKGKMSSREGNVILGEWLLDEVKKKLLKAFPKTDKETVEAIAVGAAKYSFLKTGVDKEISFDIDESISLEGNSGPYLQYTYARAQSVLQKSQIQSTNHQINSKFNLEELAVLRAIYKFPETVQQAAQELAPNVICSYLYDLAGKYNTFYNKHRILDVRGPSPATSFRLSLTAATAQILANGLSLLGISTPEKM